MRLTACVYARYVRLIACISPDWMRTGITTHLGLIAHPAISFVCGDCAAKDRRPKIGGRGMGREGELCNEYILLCPGKSIAHFSRGIEGATKRGVVPKGCGCLWRKKRCKGSRIGSPFIEVGVGAAEVGGRSTQRSQDHSQR